MWINRERYEELLQQASVSDHYRKDLGWARGEITDLKVEIDLMKSRVDREQQRADSALQTMVAHQTGVAVPMPQVAPSTEDVDPHAEDSIVVDELRDRVKKEGAMAVLLEDHRVTS